MSGDTFVISGLRDKRAAVAGRIVDLRRETDKLQADLYLRFWLNGFADHISLSPLYFMFPSMSAMVIAWLTVFAHAKQVAGASPIYALRYE